MKILLTGGGTGGHFYPIIAVAEELKTIAKENRLIKPILYYMSTDAYNETLLYENNIKFIRTNAGKIRKSRSIQNIILNFFDLFRTALVIHESDSSPGKVNSWAGKFARRIAISYPEAINFFPKEKTAYTGNPVRKEVQQALSVGAAEFFGFNKDIPTIFVIGGSQGSKFINEVIIRILPELVKKYQVIHHTGVNNIKIVEESRDVVLTEKELKKRYKPIAYLNVLTLRMAAGLADIIISRAGSTIFEIALWAKPSIIIPIPEPTSHDQKNNAYSYTRSGACSVIEEKNLVGGVLLSEIERILGNPEEKQKMINSARAFARKDSAALIANEIMSIAMEHEK